MNDFLNLESKLLEIEGSGLLRRRKTLSGSQGTRITIDGKSFLNFASNDYLGIAESKEARDAVTKSLHEFGFGSGASHLVVGHQSPHDNFEKAMAEFLERESTLSFSSGYMANLGILQSLATKGDVIIADKLNHASLIDGVKLSGAESKRYPHCDLDALEKRLAASGQNKFVVTDSVFSMDGDIAPLPDIVGLCQKYEAILIVDDAHGFGVLGENGRGICEHFELTQKQLPVLMTTLGKALGGNGAVVSGDKKLVDYLIQVARSYIYTTAMPASVAAGNLANLKLLMDNNERVEKLRQNISYFKMGFEVRALSKRVQLMPSNTAIQPVVIGDNQKLIVLNEKLESRGILVGAIRPPTVPKNSARLRVTISSGHSQTQINELLDILAETI
ncbi:8-amino-7-oxononanoate synthase [Aliikangiella sp. G2MR2-5]|uniref:8-amino-7-oxononanoate synthase n=1 Tax=Aliikangiella sp. G2MR2-5 TaxID=2788943 RepID=UPI0018AA7CF2|nr:8-amino-7-oxononanoate synthase [Aliikangiella sp. G2MR2-5]